MLRILRAVGVVTALVAAAAPGYAAQAKPVKAETKAVKATSAKTMSVSGTLEKVQGQDLTIRTTKGSEEVMFGPNVTIQRGGKTIAPAELSAAAGSHVTVRYKEENGHKMAEHVTVAAAKQPAAKSAKK